MIEEEITRSNISENEALEACNDPSNDDIKSQMEAVLTFYWYFHNKIAIVFPTSFGAGDLVLGPYDTGLTRGNFKLPHNPYYVQTHTLMTNMYNDMVKGSLPVSVLEFPAFFTIPDENFVWKDNDQIDYDYFFEMSSSL